MGQNRDPSFNLLILAGIYLHGTNCRGRLLILARLGSLPEVHDVAGAATLLVAVLDDVGVTAEEHAELVLVQGHHLEILDPVG